MHLDLRTNIDRKLNQSRVRRGRCITDRTLGNLYL